MTTPHPVYPGGPPCNPNCPGESSMYHDGYADGYENAEAAGVLLPDQPTEEREYRGIQTEAGKRLFGVVSLDAILAIEYEAAALPAPPPATPGLREALDWEEYRRTRGWPTPNHMRRVAGALDTLTPAKYGEVLRWVADACDAALAETPGEPLEHIHPGAFHPDCALCAAEPAP